MAMDGGPSLRKVQDTYRKKEKDTKKRQRGERECGCQRSPVAQGGGGVCVVVWVQLAWALVLLYHVSL